MWAMVECLVHAFDVTIIGAGIIGLASAYRLIHRHPALSVLVLEKERQVGLHQTGRNSGVLHSGLYYRPGSARARLCVQGRAQMVEFARDQGIPHEICGKVVVAVSLRELERLPALCENGHRNGLNKVEVVDRAGLREIEPFAGGLGAIWVPYAGIINYHAVATKLRDLLIAKGATVSTLTQATGITRTKNDVRIETRTGIRFSRHLINCGGLHSDRIARLDGLTPPARIIAFRGDFFELAPAARHKVHGLIYPVPDPALPFLGVHLTRRTGGEVECGPNAVFSLKREGYNKTDIGGRDALEALSYRGTWRLLKRNARYGIREYGRAFSRRRFVSAVRQLVPSLTEAEVQPTRAGVRALALGPNGTMIDDFLIVNGERSVHVLNAPSPAATAALAIGNEVADVATTAFGL